MITPGLLRVGHGDNEIVSGLGDMFAVGGGSSYIFLW